MSAEQVLKKLVARHGLSAIYSAPDRYQVLAWLKRQADVCERRNATLFAAQIREYRADYAELLAA